MGKISEALDRYPVNELFEIEKVKDETAADKVLKVEGVKWDDKKSNKDGVVYTFKGKEVATYDDQFNAVTVLGKKRK